MSYKATKPGLVFVLYLSMRYNYGIVVYWGPFLCVVSFHCYVCCLLVVLVKLSVGPTCQVNWLERFVLCFLGQVSYYNYSYSTVTLQFPYSSWR